MKLTTPHDIEPPLLLILVMQSVTRCLEICLDQAIGHPMLRLLVRAVRLQSLRYQNIEQIVVEVHCCELG